MKPLPTWRYLAKMASYRPWLYLLHAGLWSVMNLSALITGLIASAFFDVLTGHAHPPVERSGGSRGEWRHGCPSLQSWAVSTTMRARHKWLGSRLFGT